MEPSRVILWVTILVIVTCLCYTALAKTVNGVGTHSFGADITENHSCSLAKIKAESDAIRNAFGETVGATDWKMCADDECLWNSFRWTEQQGQITSILNETKVILNNPRQCRISIVANVEKIPTADPNFHLDFKINSTHYKEGAHLKVDLHPSTKMYVYIFSWTSADGFYKLYDGRIFNKITLPDTDQYAWVARLEGAKESNEVLLIVGSKQQLRFINTYTTEKLLQILQKHQRKGILVQKINYKIIL